MLVWQHYCLTNGSHSALQGHMLKVDSEKEQLCNWKQQAHWFGKKDFKVNVSLTV